MKFYEWKIRIDKIDDVFQYEYYKEDSIPYTKRVSNKYSICV